MSSWARGNGWPPLFFIHGVGGNLVEISRNYFAMDKTTNNIYYFGEDVDMYKGGKVVNHEGSWLAGTNGAKYGLAMPAEPKVGDKFYQELAKPVAMDRVEVKSLTEKKKVPAGEFLNCLKTEETSGVEKSEFGSVAKAAVDGLASDKGVIVPGLPNRIAAVVNHHLPRRLLLPLVARNHPGLKKS
jgi:hypothetical protein